MHSVTDRQTDRRRDDALQQVFNAGCVADGCWHVHSFDNIDKLMSRKPLQANIDLYRRTRHATQALALSVTAMGFRSIPLADR